MADIPSVVKYGKVTGYFTGYAADGSDAGEVPDEIPLTGSVTLEPLVRVTRWPTATPKRMAIAQTIEARVIAGVLCSPAGEPGVFLIATDQPAGQPSLIQWRATFKLNNVPQQPFPVVFNVPEWNPADTSTAVDLAMVASVTPEPPVIAVVTQADSEAAAAAAAAAQAAAADAEAAAAGAANKASIAGDLGGTPTTPRVVGIRAVAVAAGAATTAQVLPATADNAAAWADPTGGGGTGDGTVTSVNGDPGPAVVLDKTDIGLGNVDNTSDAGKPISTAQAAAINAKASVAGGDLAGTGSAPVVAKVRGVLVGTTPPSAGQVLRASSPTDASWATLVLTAASLPPLSKMFVLKDPATGFWPTSYDANGLPVYTGGSASAGVRPTARADIQVEWIGQAPHPPIVTTGTAGVRDGIDVRSVLP